MHTQPLTQPTLVGVKLGKASIERRRAGIAELALGLYVAWRWPEEPHL